MSAVFIFKINGAKKDKIFSFLRGHFSVIGGPMDMTFGLFSELCKASKKYNFAIFLKL